MSDGIKEILNVLLCSTVAGCAVGFASQARLQRWARPAESEETTNVRSNDNDPEFLFKNRICSLCARLITWIRATVKMIVRTRECRDARMNQHGSSATECARGRVYAPRPDTTMRAVIVRPPLSKIVAKWRIQGWTVEISRKL
jgi:hypothetical protein